MATCLVEVGRKLYSIGDVTLTPVLLYSQMLKSTVAAHYTVSLVKKSILEALLTWPDHLLIIKNIQIKDINKVFV